MKRVFVACLLFLCTHFAAGQLPQLSLSHQAISRIKKKNWDKAEQLLYKSLHKEAPNSEAKYALATLFLTTGYPKFNIDSADFYMVAAVSDYYKLSSKEKERLQHFPLDSTILQTLRYKIDSAAFARSSKLNTEEAFNNFLKRFSHAKEVQQAILFRDEVSFRDALKTNTSKGFQEYLQKYPESAKAAEAKKQYERLLFTEQTRAGAMESYVSFLKNHPETEYKQEIEKTIFEISTAPGTPEVFYAFINDYPTSTFIKKAKDILFYLAEEQRELTDSLKAVIVLNKNFWIPILKDGKYGFIDQFGNETLSPRYSSIDETYLCGNITSEYLVTSDGVIGRSGKVIFGSENESIEELGIGFLKVKSNNCWQLTHKSGFRVGKECIDDAKVIAAHFVAIKEKNKWGLSTLGGKQLTLPSFDDIYAEDELIVFVRSGKKVLKTGYEVAALAKNNSWKETLVCDEVRSLGQNRYQVDNGSLQGVVSNTLEYIVPLDRQQISQTPYGFQQVRNNKIKLTGISSDVDSREYVSASFYHNWIKLRGRNNLELFDGKNNRLVEANLDSLWFDNKLAFALKEDSLKVYLSLTKSISLEKDAEITFVKSVDSICYFFAAERAKKNVIEISSGKKLFSLKATTVEYLGRGIFLVENENKKGLVNVSGKILLPIEYNAIVLSGKNYVSLLKDKKFGLYNLKSKTLVKPIYERNIIPYSTEKLVASKNGFYGFVSWELKEESNFEFDEISYWNDSTAFVRKNLQWMLYNINGKKIVASNIKDYRFISNTDQEKIAIIHQGNFYGVISNRTGIVLPASYNDIINLGTAEKPLYFAEKFVEEADIHVVIYFNSEGKLIRKQAYETKEYEKIYCAEN